MDRYRFEIFLPLFHNDFRDVDPIKIKQATDEIVNEFGGCRATEIPLAGFWKDAGVLYKDEVIQLTVETKKTESTLNWFRDKKEFWESPEQFNQAVIYITYQELEVLS